MELCRLEGHPEACRAVAVLAAARAQTHGKLRKIINSLTSGKKSLPHIGTAAHSCRYSSSLFGAARQLLHQTADQLKRLSNGAQGNNFLPRPFHFFACQPSVRSHFDGLPPADSRRGLHGHLSIHTRLPRRGRDQLRQRCAAHPAQTIAPLALRVPRTSREPAPPEPVWLPGLASTTLATARAAVA